MRARSTDETYASEGAADAAPCESSYIRWRLVREGDQREVDEGVLRDLPCVDVSSERVCLLLVLYSHILEDIFASDLEEMPT